MTEPRTVSEAEIAAYVDGQLHETDVARIEAWLADHPDDAAKVHAYRLQNTLLHDAFDPVLAEGVPPEMAAIATDRTASGGRAPAPMSALLRRLAASIALIAAGAAGGWIANGMLGSGTDGGTVASVTQRFVDQAFGAHRVFVVEKRHPVEVGADQEAHLVTWLSKRLGTELKAPNLTGTGFELVGGRLLADGASPAAQFMYEDPESRRLTLYVRGVGDSEDSAFRYVTEDGDTAFYWIDRDYAYALVGDLNKAQLTPIVERVYRDLESR